MFKFWKISKVSSAAPSAPSTSKSPPQPHPTLPPPAPAQDQPPSTSTRSAESNIVLHGLGIGSGDATELGGTGKAERGNCRGTRSSEGQGVERIDFALHPPAVLPTTATTTTAQSRRPSGAASPDFDPPRAPGGSGGQLLGLERTTSPMSFAASSVTSSNVVCQSPYGAFAAAGDRDPNQIYCAFFPFFPLSSFFLPAPLPAHRRRRVCNTDLNPVQLRQLGPRWRIKNWWST